MAWVDFKFNGEEYSAMYDEEKWQTNEEYAWSGNCDTWYDDEKAFSEKEFFDSYVSFTGPFHGFAFSTREIGIDIDANKYATEYNETRKSETTFVCLYNGYTFSHVMHEYEKKIGKAASKKQIFILRKAFAKDALAWMKYAKHHNEIASVKAALAKLKVLKKRAEKEDSREYALSNMQFDISGREMCELLTKTFFPNTDRGNIRFQKALLKKRGSLLMVQQFSVQKLVDHWTREGRAFNFKYDAENALIKIWNWYKNYKKTENYSEDYYA